MPPRRAARPPCPEPDRRRRRRARRSAARRPAASSGIAARSGILAISSAAIGRPLHTGAVALADLVHGLTEATVGRHVDGQWRRRSQQRRHRRVVGEAGSRRRRRGGSRDLPESRARSTARAPVTRPGIAGDLGWDTTAATSTKWGTWPTSGVDAQGSSTGSSASSWARWCRSAMAMRRPRAVHCVTRRVVERSASTVPTSRSSSAATSPAESGSPVSEVKPVSVSAPSPSRRRCRRANAGDGARSDR